MQELVSKISGQEDLQLLRENELTTLQTDLAKLNASAGLSGQGSTVKASAGSQSTLQDARDSCAATKKAWSKLRAASDHKAGQGHACEDQQVRLYATTDQLA